MARNVASRSGRGNLEIAKEQCKRGPDKVFVGRGVLHSLDNIHQAFNQLSAHAAASL
jgi:hypothetical protein